MFQNKVVAITGAASGIGRALAVDLASRGACLALADVNLAGLDETASQLPSGTQVRTYSLDVSSKEAVFAFADSVQRDFGAAHFVINNAGTAVLATVEHVSIEEIEKVIAINLWGVIYGTKAFLPIMLKQREGCIVNISSVFGLVATPCSVAYTMSKFAVRGLTETLWQELEGTGVRAVSVHPGGINTNITKAPEAKYAGEFERKMAEANLRQMTTTPADCAREIVDGLARGNNRLLVGNGAKALHWISRLFPNSYGALMRRKLGI
ncbi:MAG: SDR family oxidoreductase [Burkholderiaceae bacterium]|jgi:NAD(P)-dependent dehydrogenase (short-subunit alcohol dehydrogenase family)|nr:SDR family oxidoreductase [Burkholderiaceae bacterium]